MLTINETLPVPKTALQRMARMANAWYTELNKNSFVIRTSIPVHIHSEEVPITVQGLGESKELDWCNHASSYLTLIPNDVSDNPLMVVATVCNKCNSTQNEIGEWNA